MAHAIEIAQYADRPVVRASGELDILAAPDLRAALTTCHTGDDPHLIVDLGGVTFLDSSVLGVLVGALRRARDRGGDLWLIAGQPSVLTVLRVTNLDRVIRVRRTLESAVAEVAGDDAAGVHIAGADGVKVDGSGPGAVA